MKKVFAILKKLIIPIIVVIALLFAQAMCDLKLPDYTANIVNIGIQQGGIKDSVHEAIREEEMNKILLFVDNKDLIKNNYSLITKSSSNYQKYIKKYPNVKGSIYILNDIDEEVRVKINNEMKIPVIIVSALESDKFDATNYIKSLGMSSEAVTSEADILRIIATLDNNTIKEIKKKVIKSYEEIGDSIINQASVAAVKKEYQEIGLDIKDLQISYIKRSGLEMLSVAFIAMIITIITTFLSSKIGTIFSRDLRTKTVTKVMNFSNREFEEISTASLITRSTNDIQQIQMLVVMLLRIVIYAPILGIGALMKVSKSPLSWVIGVAVALILSIIILLFVFVMPKFKLVQKLIDKINLISREILNGLPVIRAFSNEKYENNRFDEGNKNLTKVNLFVDRAMSIMMPTMAFIMNSIAILIVWIGASKIDLGYMQVGDLLAFITYTMQIIMSFLMIAVMSIFLPRAWVSVKRIAEVLNKETSVKEKENKKHFNEESGIIEFKDVYFRYPDAEEDVLKNISFKAIPGTTTAFIGSTGSGKSTLINLIPRFYDVTGGKILIDGVNIKDVSLQELRSKLGYVPQKGVLFSGTIESNIAFGMNKKSDKEIKEAARISQSLEFIENKKDKFSSSISQGGTNVSGGQRQRLSIARAIASDPDIYIFDDSFSALDYQTDLILRKELAKVTKNKTILIVAQRISTVLRADQIVVLDQGQIVGIGSHKELLKNCSIYKEIALSQLKEEELYYE